MRCLDCKFCTYDKEIDAYKCLNSDSEFYGVIVWEYDFCMDYDNENIGA